MAKKSLIEREKKRRKLYFKYKKKRSLLQREFKKASSFTEIFIVSRKLQQIPRNSCRVRLHNRCFITGRPKGFYRDFGISRLVLREMINDGVVPGIRKASW